MSGVRENILSNLETGINALARVKYVTREKLPDTAIRNMEIPGVNIMDEGDTFVKRSGDYNIEILNVRLGCHVQQEDNENRHFNYLLADLRAYLVSVSLNDDVHYIRAGDVGTPETGDEKAIFSIEVKIRYRYLRSAP
jgi:hypothetical protein